MQSAVAPEQNRKILFIIGKDRPGIVREVAQYLTDRGASIEDSRMAVMGGLFSMTIMVSPPRCQRPHPIERDTRVLNKADLSFHFHRAGDQPPVRIDRDRIVHLEVRCMDHAGVVKEVVRVLHEHDVNIHTMDTGMQRAPFFGTPIFHLAADVILPPGTSTAELHADMAVLAGEEDLDINLVMPDGKTVRQGPQAPGCADAIRPPVP